MKFWGYTYKLMSPYRYNFKAIETPEAIKALEAMQTLNFINTLETTKNFEAINTL